MKKVILLLAVLFSIPAIHAQTDDTELDFDAPVIMKEKGNAFFMGPKLGVTISSLSQPEEGKLADGAGVGISGGLAMKARFGKASENSAGGTGFIGAGLELKYVSSSAKTIATNQDGKENAALTLGYFDIPVFAQVYPLAKVRGMNSLYVEVGVNFGALVSRSPKTLTLNNPGGEFSKVVYNIDNNGSKLKGGNICPLVGLGYTIPGTGLDINARYKIGASKLAGNFPSKMSSFEISLAWMFGVCKF